MARLLSALHPSSYLFFRGLRHGLRLSFIDDDAIQVGEGVCILPDRTVVELTSPETVSFANLDVGSRTVGRDYYVFATRDGFVLSEVSDGKLAPSGYSESNSRLLGYFHNGRDYEGGDATGAIFEYSVCSNDLIVPATPYVAHPDLPAGVPLPGMVRVGPLAIGIYLASRYDATPTSAGSSTIPRSQYGVPPWASIQGWEAMQVAAQAGCRLPTWAEWLMAVEFNPGVQSPARMNGNTYYGSASDDDYLGNPGAPTAAVGAAGNLTGDYKYVVTFVNARGETRKGTASATVSPAAQQVNLTNIPLGGAGTTARKIYRTTAGGNTYYYVATINDNVTTTYTDDLPDSSLGAQAPEFNSTGAQRGQQDPTYMYGRTLTGTGPRTTNWGSTPAGRSWYSPAGLADPVGNVWEWVAQFFGGLKTSSPGTSVSWGYESDRAYNFQGQVYNPDTGGWTEGLPALLLVGGYWSDGSSAGVRAAYANYSPGNAYTGFGFRLAR